MGGGADEAVLEIAAHAVGDGERDNERGHARSDAEDRDSRNEADDRLAAASAEIAESDEEFEAHAASMVAAREGDSSGGASGREEASIGVTQE